MAYNLWSASGIAIVLHNPNYKNAKHDVEIKLEVSCIHLVMASVSASLNHSKVKKKLTNSISYLTVLGYMATF